MTIVDLLDSFEDEILDPEEETFFLFSQPIPSQNLGFIDPKASELDVTVAGRDFTVKQSPAVLSSNREGGTTGAVLWKITPLFAEWLTSPTNPFLSCRSTILELGCGISALTALAAGPYTARYVLTDQTYVSRLVQHNLETNKSVPVPARQAVGTGPSAGGASSGGGRKQRRAAAAAKPSPSSRRKPGPGKGGDVGGDIRFTPLDWELDVVHPSLLGAPPVQGTTFQRSFDVVVACDCVYNDALVAPLVQTCADACEMREAEITELAERGENSSADGEEEEEEEEKEGEGESRSGGKKKKKKQRKCVCIVAQQLRSPEVLETWLKAFHEKFRVWRVPDEVLVEGLRVGSGFVVHAGVLR